MRGLASALSGSAAAENVTKPGTTSRDAESKTIGELEIAAVAASVKRDHEQAADLMKQAIKLEEEMGPPSGPPALIKPAHELFGEILLRAGKPEAAAEQFKVSLLRQPNRARSLLGAARAAAAEWGSARSSVCLRQAFGTVAIRRRGIAGTPRGSRLFEEALSSSNRWNTSWCLSLKF